jgi:hypothetical protein
MDEHEMKERMVKLETLQERDIHDADEWRKRFCEKVDKILDFITTLPCKERLAWYDACGKQMKFLWAIVSTLIVVLLTVLAVQYSMAREVMSEINTIKQYSYGYQEHANGRIPEWRKQ